MTKPISKQMPPVEAFEVLLRNKFPEIAKKSKSKTTRPPAGKGI